MISSNLSVRSNLMIDDAAHKPHYRYVPGDYVGQIYPEFTDVRVYGLTLSQQQINEMRQYLVCRRCGRPCAGMCR